MNASLLLPLLLALPAPAPPPALHNAKTTSHAVSSKGLAAEVRSLSSSSGPVWIGYAQSLSDGPRQMCCFGSVHTFRSRGSERPCCGGCRLETEGSFSIGRDEAAPVALESPPQFFVLLRVERGRVGRVGAFSPDCALDAGGLPFLWLTGVDARDSLNLLTTLARRIETEGEGEEPAEQAFAAIALHADPAADSVLEKLARRGEPLELRKKAAFWLGNERGRRGFEILRTFLADPDPAFRHHLTFCLSQSSVTEAQATLIRMARHDPEGEVRGQALFWLAQRAGEKAAEAIQDAIRDDPEEDVKIKAVFALSQLHGDEAVKELIRVAKTNRNPEVRKQAIFWLGQSKDPRALEFIEKILER
ncbi:MAG TPA: HEAT repeat domain-containing protein [Thermoanaerobaculia bacterium]|jgi:HEAT repeat protein